MEFLKPMMHDHTRTLAEVDRLLDDARSRITALTRYSAPYAQAALTLRQIIDQRRLRDRYFEGGLFADPAWDILLELTSAYLRGEAVPVSAVAVTAGIPSTTALRWIGILVDRGLAVREPDPTDKRRVYIRLSDAGWEKMRSYMEHASIIDVA